jgi:hypothetical protein
MERVYHIICKHRQRFRQCKHLFFSRQLLQELRDGIFDHSIHIIHNILFDRSYTMFLDSLLKFSLEMNEPLQCNTFYVFEENIQNLQISRENRILYMSWDQLCSVIGIISNILYISHLKQILNSLTIFQIMQNFESYGWMFSQSMYSNEIIYKESLDIQQQINVDIFSDLYYFAQYEKFKRLFSVFLMYLKQKGIPSDISFQIQKLFYMSYKRDFLTIQLGSFQSHILS